MKMKMKNENTFDRTSNCFRSLRKKKKTSEWKKKQNLNLMSGKRKKNENEFKKERQKIKMKTYLHWKESSTLAQGSFMVREIYFCSKGWIIIKMTGTKNKKKTKTKIKRRFDIISISFQLSFYFFHPTSLDLLTKMAAVFLFLFFQQFWSTTFFQTLLLSRRTKKFEVSQLYSTFRNTFM